MKTSFLRSASALVFGVTLLLPAARANSGESELNKTATTYIADFQRGIDFNPGESVAALMVGGRVDKTTMSTLRKALATGTTFERENIVRLLEKLGLALDLTQPDKFPVIRDHAIIRALLVEGFAKHDAASSAALGILREQCKPEDLATLHDIFEQSLQQSNGDFLYLAAKAKTLSVRPLVERTATLPQWQKNENNVRRIKIAQAALGNTAIEEEFIQATYDTEKTLPPAPEIHWYNVGAARDGTELAKRLETLGLIGTRRSLLVACDYLRSPLKSYVKDVSERSIRDDALAALHYNFPDERVLYRRRTVEEWAAAELFCTQKLGAVFNGPTPHIPAAHPYPRMR